MEANVDTIINSKITDFKVQAYQNEEFIEVNSKDLNGKWSIFSFILLILHLFALLN